MVETVWTEQQNKMRSDRLKGRKQPIETRAKMSAARIVGADKEGTPEYDAVVDAYIQREELRERIVEAIERRSVACDRLDVDDPRWRPYTVTYRRVNPSSIATAIKNQRLDDHLEEIAATLGI